MRISVIIPCFNVERWLPRCLDSVLVALPADAEVIAVDDGSTDSTLVLLRERAKSDARLHVIAASHRGVSAARNRGLDIVHGKYVFFVDPDDGVAPDYFSTLIGMLERDWADCCICNFDEIPDGGGVGSVREMKGDYRFRSNAEIVSRYLPRIFGYSFEAVRAWYRGRPLFSDREFAAVWRMAYRRDVIEAGHIRFAEDVTYWEDMVFNAEYLLRASSMTFVRRALYHVTVRNSSMTKTVPQDGLRYCRNKLALLRQRDALNRKAGGALTPLYAATNVLSALEILSYVLRHRVPFAEGRRIFLAYLAVPSVRAAVRGFPLSVRRPILALAVLVLRGLVHCGRERELL